MLMPQMLCCGGRTCCTLWCASCKGCGIPAKTWPKIAYLCIDTVFMLISLILMYSLQGAAEKWDWFQCLENT